MTTLRESIVARIEELKAERAAEQARLEAAYSESIASLEDRMKTLEAEFAGFLDKEYEATKVAVGKLWAHFREC